MTLSRKRKAPENDTGFQTHELGSESEEEDLEKLEADVNQMAQKIFDYRANLPDQLKTTLNSILLLQRPRFPESGSEPGPSRDCNPDSDLENISSEGVSVRSEEQRVLTEKLNLLKEKISTKKIALTNVAKKLKDCISSLDKLQMCNERIHPVFRSKLPR